jgi:hypothetical protein
MRLLSSRTWQCAGTWCKNRVYAVTDINIYPPVDCEVVEFGATLRGEVVAPTDLGLESGTASVVDPIRRAGTGVKKLHSSLDTPDLCIHYDK